MIREDRLPLRVMLGAYLGAEMNNFGCPWGGSYAEEQLEANRRENAAELDRLIALARAHEDSVFSVAVGNEARSTGPTTSCRCRTWSSTCAA